MIGETELVFTKVNSTAFRVWWNRDRNFTGNYNITAPPSDQQMLMSHNSIPFADFEGVLSSTVYNVLVETGPSGPVAAGSVRTGKFTHLQLMVIPHFSGNNSFRVYSVKSIGSGLDCNWLLG